MSSFVDVTITSCTLYRYQIELNPSLPVGKQRIDFRKGLVLEIQLNNHQTAWAEIAPLSGLDINNQELTGFSQESLAEVQSKLQQVLADLIDKPLAILHDMAKQISLPSLAFALSLLHAKLTHKLPIRIVNPQTQSAVVPLLYHGMSTEVITQKLLTQGAINSVKVKVAQTDMVSEIEFIYQVLAIAPQVTLRLDANRGFSPVQAIDFLACLPKHKIEYIEEPCINPSDNMQIYRQLAIKYALDESLNLSQFDLDIALQQPGLGALIIKPMLLGSLEKLQSMISQAHLEGVRCILSSSLEADMGIGDLRLVSQALTPDESPGLDTLSAFTQPILLATSGLSPQLNHQVLQQLIHSDQARDLTKVN
ncbi:o-succinylbenzoate synthase [Shewanella livingstonensis]|uniref:o-succinylbenzoate synthase n=1 Tax=Shewanella livingstonensis TaxID=150120 RepID=A0A3G8LZC6_9GAMM|nr:o-succinylbenzoate synthase [Shewanella livingstonensis]AZG75029.1 o-succinylbenzoate synthase [Shewanella livingstonensis]